MNYLEANRANADRTELNPAVAICFELSRLVAIRAETNRLSNPRDHDSYRRRIARRRILTTHAGRCAPRQRRRRFSTPRSRI